MKKEILFLKSNVKIIVECISRKLHKNNIFSFKKEGILVKFYLPWKKDHIQQQIIIKGKFYEEPLLEKTKKYVQKGAVIDIGGNIGNHAVFFGLMANAKKIYTFEPSKKIFEVLKKNIYLNNLQDKVKLYNIALGDKNTRGDISFDGTKINNSGVTSIRESKTGEIQVLKLDDIGIKDKVDLIKIDVEGFEQKVLKGSKNLIKKNKPAIWVETSEFPKINNLLSSLNYKLKERIAINNYLFIQNDFQD